MATFQHNISQHSWAQHVARVWPPCCNMCHMLGVANRTSALALAQLCCTNLIKQMQHHATSKNGQGKLRALIAGASSVCLSSYRTRFSTNQRVYFPWAIFSLRYRKTCSVFPSSYRNTSGSLKNSKKLRKHTPVCSCPHSISHSPKLPLVFLFSKRPHQLSPHRHLELIILLFK